VGFFELDTFNLIYLKVLEHLGTSEDDTPGVQFYRKKYFTVFFISHLASFHSWYANKREFSLKIYKQNTNLERKKKGRWCPYLKESKLYN
jgi:hypothetical protein